MGDFALRELPPTCRKQGDTCPCAAQRIFLRTLKLLFTCSRAVETTLGSNLEHLFCEDVCEGVP